MPLHVSSTCAHHEEVKIALHSPWYYHTYRYDDARGCVMQFWPHDYEHMCSKHVEAWNKLMVKQKFCASSSLITEVNILRCTVSKTPKSVMCSASRFCFFSCHFAVYLHFEDAAERTKSFFLHPMPHMSFTDFVVFPPGHGRSVTDFWRWDTHEARLRCPNDVSGDIGGCSARRALKPKFY